MSSKKVVIVDDDARNIFALKAVLKSRKFDVTSASSGPELFALLNARHDVGIVLLDMMIPEMDGYEILKEMKRMNLKTVPVIAVTAQAMVGDREKCLAAGADDYLSKPVNVDALANILEKYSIA
jgi:two-component system, cell cycle response regulator DivK